MISPLAVFPLRVAKKAPVTRMDDLLAAFILLRTGRMFSFLKPASRYASSDHKFDIAPESVTAFVVVVDLTR